MTWFSSMPVTTQAVFVTCMLLLVGGIIAVIVLAATGKFSSSSTVPTTPIPTVPDTTVVAPTFEACQTPPCFNVGNTCPFPIWIHAVNNPASGSPVTLTPDMQQLQPGEAIQLSVPQDWPAGRVNAYYKDPTTFPEAFDKVEMTVSTNGHINFDITYVDYLALPSSLQAGPGAVCANNLSSVACEVKVKDVLNGCPSGDDFSLLDTTNQRCLSAGLFCSNPDNKDNPFCHLLDSTLNQCVSNPSSYPNCQLGAGDNTANVYSCSGYFDGQPSENHTDGNKWCAALNRNMLSAPDSTDTSQFYKGTAINQYAKWVHTLCPGIYSFAYDDYPPGAEQSGDRDCVTDRLDILWCPANAV